MHSDVDSGPEAQTGVVSDNLAKLSINVLFDRRPFVSDPDNSSHEFPMKPISPILRFPVELSSKDAGVIEEALQTALVAGFSLEIYNADGSPRYYRLFVTK